MIWQVKKWESEWKLGEGRNWEGMSEGARRMEGKESEGSKKCCREEKYDSENTKI